MLAAIAQGSLVALGLFLTVSTFISTLSASHWYIRGSDFPRAQALAALLLIALLYALFFTGNPWGWAFVAACVAAAAWQCYKIFPYTPLAPRHVLQSRETVGHERVLTIVISNVEMENRQFDRWLAVVRDADPDIILAAEVDQAWIDHLGPLRRAYPHHLEQPQENHFGMALYSRLPLEDPTLEFLVQDDIPSIHTWVRLRSGERIRLHGLHPRPPEPIRNQDATPRDAELVVVGRHVSQHGDRPALVVGDLNDVAWSRTTTLFQHLSGLLDPRKGRGMYNTYHARVPLFRFPLDHVFHSDHFTLVKLRRLDKVGSDHFPVYAALHFSREAQPRQPEPPRTEDDLEEAHEKIKAQVKAEANGDEEGHLHERV